MAIKINISGKEPIAETIRECEWAGWPVGTAIKAYGSPVAVDNGQSIRSIWHYIWMGNDVRKPNDLEEYLFRN